MIKKDRYSHAFIIAIIGMVLFIVLFRMNKKPYGTIVGASSLIPFFLLTLKGARIHLTDAQREELDIEFKDEDDCGFTPVERKYIDGIRVDGVRYKFVDGTDAYIDSNNVARPCGFGSAIMQRLGGGGVEPPFIQENDCWK